MDASAVDGENKALAIAIRYKFQILSAGVFLCVASAAYYAAPNFVSVIAYFWPLLLSTALFLVAIVFFGRAAPSDPDACVVAGAGGDIMDYVAGDSPETVVEADDASSSAAASPEQL